MSGDPQTAATGTTPTTGDATPATADPLPPADDPRVTGFRAFLDQDVQDRLRAAIEAAGGPLSARALGRMLSRVEKGLDNAQKGRIIADVLGYDPVPPEACAWDEGMFEDLEPLAALVEEAVAGHEFDTILLGNKVPYDIQELEARVQEALGPYADRAEPLKTELNRELGSVVVPRLGVDVDFTRPDLNVVLDPYFETISVTSAHLYLAARYRKFDRTIPQTKWPCNKCRGRGCTRCDQTGQQYGTSVEGELTRVAIEAFDGVDASFHGGGREDIDALMLGTGRPFVLEVKEPRWRTPRDPEAVRKAHADGDPVAAREATIDLIELARRINESAAPRAELDDLQVVDKDQVVVVKEAALDKAYRAHIVADAPVTQTALEAAVEKITAAPLEQRTPQRVAHRRADKVRTRSVRQVDVTAFGHHAREAHDIQVCAEKGEPHPEAQEVPEGTTETADGPAAQRFTLDLVAESGTYIKELVHGDEGRTQPNFSELIGIPMRVAYLDVVGIGK